MREIVITPKQIRKELILFLCCFIVSNIANIYAIAEYNGSASEMITSIGFVTITSLAIYFVVALLRTICYFIKRIIKK